MRCYLKLKKLALLGNKLKKSLKRGSDVKSIVIMVDMKKRDLPAYVVLKSLLEKQYNLHVFFVRNGLELPVAYKKKSDVVVITQCLSLQWYDLAMQLKSNGSKVVVLPTEGYPVKNNNKIRYATGGNINYHSCLDRLYAWNGEMLRYSIELGNIDDNLVKLSGVPRFDLYKKKYVNLRRAMYKNHSKSTVILFPTNFTYADYIYYGNTEELIEQLIHFQEKNIEDAKSYAEHVVNADKTSRDLFVGFVKDVSKRYNIKVIIKPHPFERIGYWEEHFAQDQNVEISVNDYIWGVIEESDIVIARSCSTQIEAFMLDKCTVELVLNPNDAYISEDPPEGSYIVRNLKEFDDFFNLYQKGEWLTPVLIKEREKAIKKHGVDDISLSSIECVAKDLSDMAYSNMRRCQLSMLTKLKLTIKYYLLTSFNYFFHDLLIQGNRKKNILGKTVYCDNRGRIDKHFHNQDIEFIESNI